MPKCLYVESQYVLAIKSGVCVGMMVIISSENLSRKQANCDSTAGTFGKKE